MVEVDLGYIGKYEMTIYSRCFQRYIHARYILKRSEADWSKLASKTEKVFKYLVKEGDRYGFDIDSILETTDLNGSTCFSIASQCSRKIANFIIGRGIKVNNITTDMMIPAFKYPELAVPMMAKKINPHVIDYNGFSQMDGFRTSFQSEEARQLSAQFPISIHFSIENISCPKNCATNCPSKFKKFYFKNGEFVKMTDANKIGQGGFGSVFKGSFHGEEKAMKCVLIGKIEERTKAKDAVSDLEQNISEIRIQIASGGSGVIVPEAFVRQQNQEQDKDGKWIAKNYNIYIYPLYDCNLYELHDLHFDQFKEEFVGEIIHQCFIRKGFYNSTWLKLFTRIYLDVGR